MSFGVFIHRLDSIYDDSPAERYQFPKQYLGRAEACVRDWIVYYESRKVVATRGYFAVAKVQEIVADPNSPGMYFAIIEPGSYVDFANPVAFSGEAGVLERGLLNAEGRISGRAQAAVRPISIVDFLEIVNNGLADMDDPLPRRDGLRAPAGFSETQMPFALERDESRLDFMISRVVRDRAFRKVVLHAYGSRCAMTGWMPINGGGRAEGEAAHIQSVEARGPDSVANGLALSGTVHWMFDRGLISVADDFTILLSRQLNDFSNVTSIMNKSGRISLPTRPADRPHPHFLRWHRENCFKS